MPRPKGLAKKRPQKTKVLPVESAPAVVLSTEEENAGGAPVVLAAPASLPPASCAAVSSSPDRKRLEEALIFADERGKKMDKMVKHYKAKEKVAKRLYEAKMRRADGINRKRKPKNPFGVTCRIYEAIIKLNSAELHTAMAERDAMKAQNEIYAVQIHLLELEIARLRR